MKLVVSVTQKDIDNGVRMSIGSCPHALALKRACKRVGLKLKDNNSIVVSTEETDFYIGTGEGYYDWRRKSVKNPEEVRNWIRNFDNGKKVRPMRYVVEVEA